MTKQYGLGVLTLATVFGLGACENAAHLGDVAVHRATLGHIDTTFFKDFYRQDRCEESLTRSLGFTHQTQGVVDGVHVIQTFDCRGDRIVAQVSMKNLNPYPMECFAQTEEGQFGSVVGPNGFARMEYSFTYSSSHSCSHIG